MLTAIDRVIAASHYVWRYGIPITCVGEVGGPCVHRVLTMCSKTCHDSPNRSYKRGARTHTSLQVDGLATAASGEWQH